MLGPRWRRLVAALIGAWMVVILTTPMALWACPAHGGPHHMTMTNMDMSHHDQQPGHDHNQCTCPGCCCCVAAVGLAVGRLVALPVVPVTVVTETPAPVVGAPRDLAPRHRLPLPLGPPAIRV
jgi:hypothetical protein